MASYQHLDAIREECRRQPRSQRFTTLTRFNHGDLIDMFRRPAEIQGLVAGQNGLFRVFTRDLIDGAYMCSIFRSSVDPEVGLYYTKSETKESRLRGLNQFPPEKASQLVMQCAVTGFDNVGNVIVAGDWFPHGKYFVPLVGDIFDQTLATGLGPEYAPVHAVHIDARSAQVVAAHFVLLAPGPPDVLA